MKKPTAIDALDLSIPERIQLVEDIWDTIAVKADLVELTEQRKRYSKKIGTDTYFLRDFRSGFCRQFLWWYLFLPFSGAGSIRSPYGQVPRA